MKYIKTYEVFKNFSFLWSKDPIKNEEEWLAIIDECFYELEDVGFIVSPLYKTNKSGEVLIEKLIQTARQPFMLSDVLPTIEVALSYLKDQYGIVLDEIEFLDRKLLEMRRGYGKLKYIKDDYEVFHVKLKLVIS